MSEFTKGEWEVLDGTKVGEQVLFVHAPEIKGVICILTHTANPSIPLSKADFANAHLIAAAPEMYAALEHIMNNQALGSPLGLSINNLLAKARGE
jgi:hypothetical protein